MSYIYRALSESDIRLNPEENGLVSKNIIDEAVTDDINLYIAMRMQEFKNIKLNKSDYNEIFRTLKPVFIDTKKQEILRTASIKNEEIARLAFNLYLNPEDKDAIISFYRLLADVNTHLGNGNTVDTNWISFSKDLNSCLKYYLDQPRVHQVAVIDSSIDNCVDNGILALDLSSQEEINKVNKLLVTKDLCYTDMNYRGLKYAKGSKEIIYRNYIPEDRIVNVLGTLEVELLLNSGMDYEILKHKSAEKFFLLMVKNAIKQKLIDENSSLLDFYEKVYIDNRPLVSLTKYKDEDYNELLNKKRYILSKYNELNFNHPFKKELKKELRFPEEYN